MIDNSMNALPRYVQNEIEKAVRPLKTEIADLKARIAKLEKPGRTQRLLAIFRPSTGGATS